MAGRTRAVLSGSSKDALPESVSGDGYSYLPWVDLICAGVPCQDFSVAGKRAGLAGSRAGLFYEFARILRELRPTWFLFENVPGLLSSNHGRDFAEVLRVLMVECGYGVSWRVLDSQFFGVALRRRRLFIVGRFGKPCPPEVLFEPEGGEGNIATDREARKDVAVPLTSGAGVTGNSSGRHQEDDFNIVVGPLGGSSRSGGFSPNCEQAADGHFVTAPVDGTWAKGGSGKSDYPVGLVATALSASAGRHGHSSPRGDGSDNLVCLESGQANASIGNNQVPNLTCLHEAPIVIQDARGQREKRQNGIGISEGGPMYTLDGTSQHAVAYALRRDPGGTGQGHNTNYAIVGRDPEHQERASELGRDPRGDDGDNGGAHYVSSPSDSNGVRDASKLSERMDYPMLPQGLDSARYRALGNAVTTSVIKWIGRRIVASSGVESPSREG